MMRNFWTYMFALGVVSIVGVHGRVKEHVPGSVWDRMTRYTAFQAASGFVPCQTAPYGSTIVKYININLTDTQATIFRDDKSKEFIVALPGTASLEDIFFDVLFVQVPFLAPGIDLVKDCFGCLVHKGFLDTWDSIAGPIISTLKSGLASHPGYTVTISGHSLGAAIASLGYASLKGVGLPINQAYTFGQPRSGNQAFADHIDKLSKASDDNIGEFWRITHADDFIPRILPTFVGYTHSRTELWQMNNTSGESARSGPDLTFRCFGQEPSDCNNQFAPLQGTGISHGFYTNHDISTNYSCIGTS